MTTFWIIYMYFSSQQNSSAEDILNFFGILNELKFTSRYRSTLDKRGDSVAEHSWMLALMISLLSQHFDIRINTQRAMEMALIHDIAELKTGDIDAYDQVYYQLSKEEKMRSEELAVQIITKNCPFSHYLQALWDEYHQQLTLESKLVKALDKLEAYMHVREIGAQHYRKNTFFSKYADNAVESFSKAYPNNFTKDMLRFLKQELKNDMEAHQVFWKEE